ncbi:MAG: hypothetical protein FJ398_27440 [Verrucomicrobia bacterium]|nr:hypothetical protein [Verrucomicrobiota bacterium]
MPSLRADYPENSIIIGNHQICDVKRIQGLEDLPGEIDGRGVLSLELPSISIRVAETEVGKREFYLCYAPKPSLLFVVETEMSSFSQERYSPDYGRNDNYYTHTTTQRIVWVYKLDSPRLNDPVVTKHLRPYLP